MKAARLFLLAITMLSCVGLIAKPISLTSPNGKIKIDIDLAESVSYSVSYEGEAVLEDCVIGMNIDNQVLGNNPKLKSVKKGVINKSEKPAVPIKNAVVNDYCNTLTLKLKGDYSIEWRAYDDGVAYRFVTAKKGKVKVFDEIGDYHFPENSVATMSQNGSFRCNYEEKYQQINVNDYKSSDKMNYPPLYVQTPTGIQVLMSESGLEDYPCLFFKSNDKHGMKAVFPKYPLEVKQEFDRFMIPSKEADYIAETEGTRNFPWRFFVISKDARDIVANEMEYKLAVPCVLDDTSWIRPGQVSWDWWNGRQAWGVDFVAGCNEDTYKHYIDFASKYHIPYIILDEGWAVNTADPLTSNKDIDLQRLIAYGKQKGVDLIIWLTWLEVERNMNLFEQYAKWGIAGVKIDFMDRSDQWMVNYYERVCKEAAKHHILVDFHGAFKPAGLERKYPNLLSYEGVLGLEQGGRCQPENTNWIPFIRNAVGPVDFTPGGMINVQPQDNHSTSAVAMASGTRAYQMALYVMFSTGLQMLADCPTRYYQNPDCTEYIASVPVLWDETKVLLAEPGKYVVMARRSGKKWFVGAINDGQRRDLNVDLSFIGNGNFKMTAFADGINADRQAMDYKRTETNLTDKNTTLHLARNGGFAAVIE